MRVPLLVGGNPNVLVFRYTGNGSATFDPSITTSSNVNVSWKPDDGPETVTTGTTHNFSYTPSSGSHLCMVRVAGGLGLVTAIDCNTDSLTRIAGVRLLRSLATWISYTNSGFVVSLSDFVGKCSKRLDLSGCDASGSISQCPASATLLLHYTPKVTGSLSDLSAVSLTVYLQLNPLIASASIAHLVAARDIRIYSMWSSLSAAECVDVVINSMWASRADYTYATPSLHIGGTNPAPTGNSIAPEEGTDWHLDGATWIPLTPNAKAYDLVNDVNEEGFNTWTITKS